jgi:protein-tyrosine phosphatase
MDTDHPVPEPFRLLFVCTGNTCRSPLAEVIARRRLMDLGWNHVEVRSAGVGAWDGGSASSGSLAAAVRHGADLSDHRSSRVTPELLDWADMVLAMSPSHVMHLAELGAKDKSELLTTFAAGADPQGVPDFVSDPVGGSDEDYEETYVLLDRLVDLTLRRLRPVVAP